MRPQLSKLDRLYQTRAGEECYIFGDGISLKWMDLSRFRDRPSIIGNMMVYHRDVHLLDKPFCVLNEPFWFWPIFPYGGLLKGPYLKNRMHRRYREAIRENPDTIFCLNFSNFPVVRSRNVLFVSRWYKPPFALRNPFAERPDSHDGTLLLQVSLAIFLGFRKVYLVGHDYTHTPSRIGHFYEKGEGPLSDHSDFCRDFLSYAKQHVDLVTVTVDAGSDRVDSITYENLTGDRPRFRENVELVNGSGLKTLATWPGYRIF